MKVQVSRTAGIAALAALGFLLPASAQAQTFVDPRQAPADQYGTPTPTPVPTATPTPVPRVATPTPTPDGDDDGREASGGRRDTGRDAGGNEGAAGDGDAGAVRRESGSLASQLPFTGLNLATLILMGLMLAVSGLAIRAMQARKSRRS